MDGHVFCEECAARPDVDYLEGYRLKHWGKRDGWAWFFGLSGALNLVVAFPLFLAARLDQAPELYFFVGLAVLWGATGLAYFFRVRAARFALFALVLLQGAIQATTVGPAAFFGIVIPLLVVASAFGNVRSRLFFKLDLPRATLKKEWDRYHNNVMAQHARTLGTAGVLIPIFAPFAILTGVIGWRRVDPNAHPPIGRKGSAIAGVVLGTLSTLVWGGILIAVLVSKR